MKKKILSIAGICFILGVLIGVYKTGPLRASSPEGEISQGSGIISYDEEWKATHVYVTKPGSTVYDLANADDIRSSGVVAGAGDSSTNIITTYPDCVVARWKVHGHLHYE